MTKQTKALILLLPVIWLGLPPFLIAGCGCSACAPCPVGDTQVCCSTSGGGDCQALCSSGDCKVTCTISMEDGQIFSDTYECSDCG